MSDVTDGFREACLVVYVFYVCQSKGELTDNVKCGSFSSRELQPFNFSALGLTFNCASYCQVMTLVD